MYPEFLFNWFIALRIIAIRNYYNIIDSDLFLSSIHKVFFYSLVLILNKPTLEYLEIHSFISVKMSDFVETRSMWPKSDFTALNLMQF